MTLREHMNPIRIYAHQILDRVRAGLPVDDDSIREALLELGEPAE